MKQHHIPGTDHEQQQSGALTHIKVEAAEDRGDKYRPFQIVSAVPDASPALSTYRHFLLTVCKTEGVKSVHVQRGYGYCSSHVALNVSC